MLVGAARALQRGRRVRRERRVRVAGIGCEWRASGANGGHRVRVERRVRVWVWERLCDLRVSRRTR